MQTFAYEKTTGQLVGIVSRTSQPDGTGEPKMLFAPGVTFSDEKAKDYVTLPVADLDLTAINPADYPALEYEFRGYQIKDGTPTLTTGSITAVLASNQLTITVTTADVPVYARIEGDSLSPIAIVGQATGTSYSRSLVPLASGEYRVAVFAQGMPPHVSKKTVP
jgi:hypothetical protein